MSKRLASFLLTLLLICGLVLSVVLFLRAPGRAISAVEANGGEVSFYYPRDTEWFARPLGLRRLSRPNIVSIHSDIFGDEELLLLSHVSTIESLEIASGSVSDRGVGSFGDLKSLVSLKLDCPNVSDAGLANIADAAMLDLLDIQLGNYASGKFLQKFPNDTLRFLSLHGKHIRGDCLTYIKKFDRLEDLELSDTDIGDEDIDAMCSMHPLINIDVRKTRVTRQGIAKLRNAFPKAYIRWDGDERGSRRRP